MRITFLRDEIYETDGPGKGPKFSKGETIDARGDFAERWTRRGSAEAVDAKHPDIGDKLFVRLKPKAAEPAPTPEPESAPPVAPPLAAAPAPAPEASKPASTPKPDKKG